MLSCTLALIAWLCCASAGAQAPTSAAPNASSAPEAPATDAPSASADAATAPASEAAAREAPAAPAAEATPSEPAATVDEAAENTPPEVPPSQQSLDEIAALSIEDLLTAPTTVASTRAMSVRESPGVITVITREEILSSGARDLIDVLSQVPGVFVGVDVQGSLGVGMRGLWGHEGKILFLLNGHTLNENAYLTTVLTGRVPVQLVERVEIIRGPGSVRYGGYAELAVVNIVTIDAEPGKRRAYVSSNYGQLNQSWGRGNVSAAYAENSVLVEGLSLSLAANFSKAHVSDATYHDLFGNSYDMLDGNRSSTSFFDAGVSYKDFTIRYQAEDYRVLSRDEYDVVADQPYQVRFLSHHLSIQHVYRATPQLRFTPRFEYHRQFPFQTLLHPKKPWDLYTADERAEASLYAYDRLAERTSIALRADWDVLQELTLSVGSEFRYDRAQERGYNPAIDDLSGQSLYKPGSLTSTFYNVAVFGEASSTNRWVNATLGARYEHHQQFGDAFVPRLALSRVFGDLHLKALLAQAFKSPGLENINLNPDIKRERTTAIELEVGYRVIEQLLVTINAYDLTLRHPIVYFYDAVNDKEGYANRGSTGSRGLETEVRYETERVRVTGSYALYTSLGKNHVTDYAVPGHGGSLLAAPNHKLALNGHVRVWGSIHANATVMLLSKRYAQTSLDASGNPNITALDPALISNLFFEYRDLLTRGLSASLGLYNVTGQRFSYPQPYTGLHASLPALPREYLVRVSYAYD